MSTFFVLLLILGPLVICMLSAKKCPRDGTMASTDMSFCPKCGLGVEYFK